MKVKPMPCGRCGELPEVENIGGDVWIVFCDNYKCGSARQGIKTGKKNAILEWNSYQEEVSPTECHDAYSWLMRNLIKAVGIPKRLLKGKTQGGSAYENHRDGKERNFSDERSC